MAEKFKSIGHPSRIAILNLLCNCGRNQLIVKNIYGSLILPQPDVSRHLNIMRKNGILVRSQNAGKTYYSLYNEKHVNCIKKCFVE